MASVKVAEFDINGPNDIKMAVEFALSNSDRNLLVGVVVSKVLKRRKYFLINFDDLNADQPFIPVTNHHGNDVIGYNENVSKIEFLEENGLVA